MKRILSILRGHEKGQVMILALILLVVGVLIITPLLSYMGSGLKVGQVYEENMEELYAADSGVEDGYWQIITDVSGLPKNPGDPNLPYTIDDVNGKGVNGTIEYVDDTTYKINSTATGDDGSSTTVEAFITTVYGDFSDIMDNVITSQDGCTLQGPTTVDPPEGEEHGPDCDYGEAWPTPEELADFYWQDVKDETPYASGTLDVKDAEYQPPPDDDGLGPFYRDGTLSILNSGAAGLTLQLNGTVYITGDTLIGTTNKNFTIDLNGNTIFVESATIGSPYALRIGGKCTLTGSGCIIAVGDIEFKPNLDSSPDDYILVLSVTGMTYMQPNGDFYGTLAGSSEVWIQNGDAYWTDPDDVEGGLNFPGGGGGEGVVWGIATWEIS